MTATSGRTSERPLGRDVMNDTKYDLGGQRVLVLAGVGLWLKASRSTGAAN